MSAAGAGLNWLQNQSFGDPILRPQTSFDCGFGGVSVFIRPKAVTSRPVPALSIRGRGRMNTQQPPGARDAA